MEMMYGFPLVTADTIHAVLEELGVKPWEDVEPILSREEYLAEKRTDDEVRELITFAPKLEVRTLENPLGNRGHYFRSVGKNWATTFVLLPGDYLIVVGEWKHGADEVSIVPPSGVPNKEDHKTPTPYHNCAFREFREETGVELEQVIPLAEQLIPLSGRQITQRYFPFLGIAKSPVIRVAAKLDRTEFLKGVVIHLQEWMKLLTTGNVGEECSLGITLLALTELGRLKLV